MISICIPTYRRPDLLREAISSCERQSLSDWEILIGDDSPDDETTLMVRGLGIKQPVRYFHHVPSLGQASNVQFLFEQALGERLVLLHDDDLLTENALERLNSVWSEDPWADIAFGKQLISSDQGEINYDASQSLNTAFYRSDDRAGLQASSAFSGLVAQIPNDGYMIRTEMAQRIGYRDDPEVGTACDYDFGLRIGASSTRVYFVPEYTAIYRLSKTSVGRQGSDAGYRAYNLAKEVALPFDAEPYRIAFLRGKAPMAIHGYLDEGNKKAALYVLKSSDYPYRKLFSLGGLKILYRLLFS